MASPKDSFRDDPSSLSIFDLFTPTEKQKVFFWALTNYRFILYGGAAGGGKSFSLRWGLVYLLMYWSAMLNELSYTLTERASALSQGALVHGAYTPEDTQAILNFSPDALHGYVTNLRWKANEALRNSTGIEAGLFCEDYPALSGRHLTKIDREFPEWMGRSYLGDSKDMRYVLDDKFGGGVIKFRNLDNAEKYKSVEFAAIAVDEVTMNKYDVFNDLRFRLRWPGIERPVFMAGTNPGGIGHAWVKSLWIDREFPKEFKTHGLDKEFIYIPAKVTDNPHLPPSYDDDLATLPEELRKAYRDGSWDIFQGQVFEEWRRDRHVVEPFTVPVHWKRYMAYDHGYSKPYCVLWGAVDEDGVVYIYRELYGQFNNQPNVGVKEDAHTIAERIVSIESKAEQLSESSLFAGSTHIMRVADPAIWQKLGMDQNYLSLADVFSSHGVHFIRANNNRIQGKMAVHEHLRWHDAVNDEDIPPRLKIFSTCKNLIRTLPSLPYDKTTVEDVDSDAEDHAYDSLRYMLMCRPRQTDSLPRKAPEISWIDRVTMDMEDELFYSPDKPTAEQKRVEFLYA